VGREDREGVREWNECGCGDEEDSETSGDASVLTPVDTRRGFDDDVDIIIPNMSIMRCLPCA